MPDVQSDLAMQKMKDPYIFGFIVLKGQVKEKQIEDIIVEKIKNVPSDIKITSTEATRDKLISASSLTVDNFEIIK